MNSFGMLIFFSAVLIAAGGVQGLSLECPQICPDLLAPVCGSDGVEHAKFVNQCELDSFNCNRQRSSLSTYRSTDMDWCTTTEADFTSYRKDFLEADISCIKPCPMILRPVCGSNGIHRKTFSNDCEMELYDCVHKFQKKNGWRILRTGNCS